MLPTVEEKRSRISNAIDEEYKEMIEQASTKVVNSKMETVVIFFLESFRPMSSLWSQLLRLYVGPFLMIVGPEKVEKLLKFLEKPENLEYFLRRIEEKSVDKK